MRLPDSSGPLSKDHVVLVAKNLHQECLLGADFLMHHGCVLDLQQKILFTEQGPVHFVYALLTMVQVMSPCFAPVTVHENVRVGMLHPIVDCVKVRPVPKQSRPKQAIRDTIGQMNSSLVPGVQDSPGQSDNQDVIALNDNDLGCTQLLGHCIEMSDSLPVHQPA